MNLLPGKYRLAVAVLFVGMACSQAQAQNTAVADVALGYSYTEVVKGSNLTSNGGGGSVAWNFSDWLSAVGDFSLYHSGAVGPGVDAGTYTFGPRVSYRHWKRFTPFAQVLIGGVRFTDNGFVFGGGGGVDIGLDHGGRLALRPQVDYLGFRANGSTTQAVRYSIGVVFRIGRR